MPHATLMHELSIALSLVELATETTKQHHAARVETVHLRLGPLSGVVKDALVFSFEVAAAGTALDGARLEIEDVPVTAWCTSCAAERTLSDVARRRCPVCDALTPRIVRGQEIELVGLEVVDP